MRRLLLADWRKRPGLLVYRPVIKTLAARKLRGMQLVAVGANRAACPPESRPVKRTRRRPCPILAV
jgi:hypothetical protein